jgi:hypothetical protein
MRALLGGSISLIKSLFRLVASGNPIEKERYPPDLRVRPTPETVKYIICRTREYRGYMAEEGRDYIFEVYGEKCDEVPTGPQVDRLTAMIREHPGSTRMELWRLLPVPQGMNYSALANILCALEKKGLVAVDAEGRHTWTGP